MIRLFFLETIEEDTGRRKGAFVTTGINNGFTLGAISFVKLAEQIDLGFPVAFLTFYEPLDAFYHFVVVTGYSKTNGKELVIVQDPNNDDQEIEYEKFKTRYFGRYAVKATYFTRGHSPLQKNIVAAVDELHAGDIDLLEKPVESFVRGLKETFSSVLKSRNFKENRMEKNQPYKVYRANWDDILPDRNLESAYATGVRSFQEDENKRIVAYESESQIPNEISDGLKFGNMVQQHKEIMDHFGDAVEFHGLEHSLLKLEALKIHAIWFRAIDRNDNERDIFIPLKPSFYGLKPGQQYTFSEFQPILLEAAKKAEKSITESKKPF